MRRRFRLLKATLLLTTLLGGVLLVSGRADANDSSVIGEGGSWQPLHGEHPSVRMVRERVAIDIFHNDYVVTADFVFHNQGAATTAAMGFPESGGGDFDVNYYVHHSGFKGFRTWVDGKRVSVRRVPGRHIDEDYDALWVKQVHFGRGQTRRVRVRYRSEPGGYSNGSRFVNYNFTGGNWRGDVSESTLGVHFRSPGDYLYFNILDSTVQKKSATPLTQYHVLHREKGGSLTLRRTHWQAQARFSLYYVTTLPGWLDVPPTTTTSDSDRTHAELLVPGSIASSMGVLGLTQLGVQRDGITFVNLQHLRDRSEAPWKPIVPCFPLICSGMRVTTASFSRLTNDDCASGSIKRSRSEKPASLCRCL